MKPNMKTADNISEVLKQKAINGFLLSMDHFSRPWDRGRADAVLILLGYACEMLLKAAIACKGESIYGGKTTLSMMNCINELSPEGRIAVLPEEDVLALRIISAMRNNAQHLYINPPEEMLRYCVGNGIRIFRNMINSVFEENPDALIPSRILSIAEASSLSIVNIVTNETTNVKDKLIHNSSADVATQIRGLAAVENAIGGQDSPPDNAQIKQLLVQISKNANAGIDVIFPMVAVTKKVSKIRDIPVHEIKEGGHPVTLVPEDDPTAERVIYRDRKIPGDDFYPFIMKDIKSKIDISESDVRALVYYLGLRGNQKYHRLGRYGNNHYSQAAFTEMQKANNRFKQDQSYQDEVRAAYKKRPKTKKK